MFIKSWGVNHTFNEIFIWEHEYSVFSQTPPKYYSSIILLQVRTCSNMLVKLSTSVLGLFWTLQVLFHEKNSNSAISNNFPSIHPAIRTCVPKHRTNTFCLYYFWSCNYLTSFLNIYEKYIYFFNLKPPKFSHCFIHLFFPFKNKISIVEEWKEQIEIFWKSVNQNHSRLVPLSTFH